MFKISKEVDQHFEDLKKTRRFLHKNPELSGKEFNTQKFIQDYLTDIEIDNVKIADTGVKAVILSKKAKSTLLFRADIDGLPIVEKNSTDYSSKNYGVMHACGHDGHTAMVLLLAKILKNNKNKLENNIVFAFQPAEEMGGGAKRMIKEGLLKNPDVDFVFASHLDTSIEQGNIGLSEGVQYANISDFTVILEGKGGHAAHPESSNDLIAIASELIIKLHLIIPRESNSFSPSVLSVCKIIGGTKNNILPSNLNFEGTFRAIDINLLNFIRKRIEDGVFAISNYYGINGKVIFKDSYPALINDEKSVKFIKSNINDATVISAKPSLGGEDFAFMLEEKPGFMFKLGIRKNKDIALHSETFDFNEKALLYGLEFFYRIAMSDFKI